MELFNGKVIEPEYTDNTEYVLKNNEDFYDIGFRVMKNQEKDGFLHCYRLKYNGHIKLVYFTEYLTPLKQYLKRTTESQLGYILGKLYSTLDIVQENGFIDITTIDLRLERIFVDERTSQIKLVYLPVNTDAHLSLQDAKDSIEAKIAAELGGKMPKISYTETPRPVERMASPVQSRPASGFDSVRLRAVMGATTLSTSQNTYVIGKSPDKADGIIEGNPAISRQHCKLMKAAGGYMICDMGSANGTFVNGVKLMPEQPKAIKSGDKVKLANMEFVVE